jgi:hypothetical protein
VVSAGVSCTIIVALAVALNREALSDRRRRPSDRNPNGPRPAASGQAGLGRAASLPRDRARPRPSSAGGGPIWRTHPGKCPLVEVFPNTRRRTMTAPSPTTARPSESSRTSSRPTSTGVSRAAPKVIATMPLPTTTRPSGSIRITPMPTTTGPLRTRTRRTTTAPLPTTTRPSGSIQASPAPITIVHGST